MINKSKSSLKKPQMIEDGNTDESSYVNIRAVYIGGTALNQPGINKQNKF
jgi:hypothetical protein